MNKELKLVLIAGLIAGVGSNIAKFMPNDFKFVFGMIIGALCGYIGLLTD